MSSKLTKVAASLAGIALLAGVASFSTSDLTTDNKSVIKVAQANSESSQENYKDKDKKKRKGGASK